jgi:L-methionine (R)-S-oxide reductase
VLIENSPGGRSLSCDSSDIRRIRDSSSFNYQVLVQKLEHHALAAALSDALRIQASRAERARVAADLIRRAGDFGWVGIYDVTPREIAAIAWTGDQPPTYPIFPREQGLNGCAVRSRATIISNDVANDSRYLMAFATTGSEMIVPIRDEQGHVIGTIDVESANTNAFAGKERELVEACAPELLTLWIRSTAPSRRSRD